MKIAQKRHSVIGLEIGSKTIKAVQLLGRNSAAPQLCTLCIRRQYFDELIDAEDLNRFCEALSRQGFQGNTVVASIPLELQLMSLVEIPAVDGNAPVQAIASSQLATQYGLKQEELECAYWRMPVQARGHESVKALAVGCKNEQAEELLNRLQHAGLDVIALDIQSHAAARAVKACCGEVDHDEIIAVVNFGWKYACLTLILRDTVIYERILPDYNLKDLYRNLWERFNLDEKAVDYLLAQYGMEPIDDSEVDQMSQLPAVQSTIHQYIDELVRELIASLSYAEHEYPGSMVAQVLLVGGGTSIAGLYATMSKEMGAPCMAFDFSHFDNCYRKNSGLLLGAYGLALREEVAA